MNNYTLAESLYLYPTPGGGFYLVSSREEDKSRRFISALMEEQETPSLNLENLQHYMQSNDAEKCFDLLHHNQKLGWIQGLDSAMQYPQGKLEDILPGLLKNISEQGKVLLADEQGFYLASEGFPHEVAEELSALSAEMATVYERRSGLLVNNLGIGSSAWSIVDAAGNSKIGFWPVFIGEHRFVLVVSGVPHFNQAEFVSLCWALSIRYSTGKG